VKGHECHHCKHWIPAGVEHDCWTTTEHALTKDLSEDLRDAWERLRETATEFGGQRIYASHHSIMFARKACYFFVRPQRTRLEVVFWLGREVVASEIKKAVKSSRLKTAHLVHIVHRDQVEAPLTEWLREAYRLQDTIQRHGNKSVTRVKAVKASKRAKKVEAKATRAKPARGSPRTEERPKSLVKKVRSPNGLRTDR
jgi:hypothetical protein